MAVYREGYHIVEEFQKRTVQIWNDSCNAGIPVSKNDLIWNMAKQLVDWYGLPETRKAEYGFISVKISLLDEWALSDGRKSEKEAEDTYELKYFKFKNKKRESLLYKDYDGFFEITKIN